MISKAERDKYVRNSDHLYKGCLANQYFMPERKRCSAKFIEDVYT